jgi:para-aminobenzoate synthetase
MAHYHGGRVAHAPMPMHGRISAVFHDRQGLFAGLPNPLKVVRYHSLVVTHLPPTFVRTAWTQDGLTMGHRHVSRPLYGVQFHPESICTEAGRQLLGNFASITTGFLAAQPGRRQAGATGKTSVVVPGGAAAPAQETLTVTARELDFFPNPETAFVALYGEKPDAFWLDSSRHEPGLARFSYMGDAGGPRGHVLRYWTGQQRLSVTRHGHETITSESVLDYLDRELKARSAEARPDLPFEFTGGYVGYFGYELLNENTFVPKSEVPDAIFIHADRFVAFDHHEKRAWLVSCAPAADAIDTNAWFVVTEAKLRDMESAMVPPPQTAPQEIQLALRHRPLSYYRNLRRLNPAPYAAYLNFGDFAVASSSPELFLKVDAERRVESKPIKGTARRHADAAEDLRIKQTLACDEKTQAENLMIVDLLRNDLGRVCEVGSVHVPKLMDIESYATVHQMVSTIAGTLRAERSVIDCLRASFPGGSMTGAPKIRSMDMLVGLEQGRRGVYSGAIGFLGYNGHTKLNIVIRTAVIHSDHITVGSGGAIVALSDPEEELEETFVKLEPPLKALAATIGTTWEDLLATHWEGRPMFSERPAAPVATTTAATPDSPATAVREVVPKFA